MPEQKKNNQFAFALVAIVAIIAIVAIAVIVMNKGATQKTTLTAAELQAATEIVESSEQNLAGNAAISCSDRAYMVKINCADAQKYKNDAVLYAWKMEPCTVALQAWFANCYSGIHIPAI
jgi:hypothetical protein